MKEYWKATGRRPAFLIIGTQKGGTDALYTYLSYHPNIILPIKKEIHFFSHDKCFNKGTVWYHSHFSRPHVLGQHVTFEATPAYLYYPASAERIFSYDSQIMLIVLLRDPVERAFSAWNMYRNYNPRHSLVESREFDEAVRDEIDLSDDSTLEPSYVRRGIYYEQSLRYFKYFKRDQIFIIDSNSLKTKTELILNEITQFLGLPHHNWHHVGLPLMHIGKYKNKMPAKTRAILREFYKPYNEKLYKLLRHDFSWL